MPSKDRGTRAIATYELTEPGEDMHAGRGYRQHLARALTRRALERH